MIAPMKNSMAPTMNSLSTMKYICSVRKRITLVCLVGRRPHLERLRWRRLLVVFLAENRRQNDPVGDRKKTVGHKAGPCGSTPRVRRDHKDVQTEVEAGGSDLTHGAITLVTSACECVPGAEMEAAKNRKEAEPPQSQNAFCKILAHNERNYPREHEHQYRGNERKR